MRGGVAWSGANGAIAVEMGVSRICRYSGKRTAQQVCRGRGEENQLREACLVSGDRVLRGRQGRVEQGVYKEGCTPASPSDQLITAGLTAPSKSWPVARDAELCPRSISLPLFAPRVALPGRRPARGVFV